MSHMHFVLKLLELRFIFNIFRTLYYSFKLDQLLFFCYLLLPVQFFFLQAIWLGFSLIVQIDPHLKLYIQFLFMGI